MDDADAGTSFIIGIVALIIMCIINAFKKEDEAKTNYAVAATVGLAASQLDNMMKDIEIEEMRRRVAIEEQRRREMEYMAYCMAREEDQRRRQLMFYQQQQMFCNRPPYQQQYCLPPPPYCNRRNPW